MFGQKRRRRPSRRLRRLAEAPRIRQSRRKKRSTRKKGGTRAARRATTQARRPATTATIQALGERMAAANHAKRAKARAAGRKTIPSGRGRAQRLAGFSGEGDGWGMMGVPHSGQRWEEARRS